MIRAIDFKKVDMTDQEFDFYTHLIKTYTAGNGDGKAYFSDLFDADENGIITLIKPIKSIPWSILFFIQNLMINQHLRSFDERIGRLEKK